MIQMPHKEIWYWYLRIEEWRASGMKPKEFCDKHDLEYKRFCNMRYRIDYKRDSHPELYARQVPIARKYMSSGEPTSKFAKEHKIDISILCELNTHLGYVDIIEKLKQDHPKEEQPMNFIRVPNPVEIKAPEAEIVEKKNDIELKICSGVKVIVAPEVNSEKLIKIIELLKEL